MRRSIRRPADQPREQQRNPRLGLGRLSVLVCVATSGACGNEAAILWPTGVVRAEGSGRIGAEDGSWRYFYSDGQLRERGQFENGRRFGEWVQWWPNGQRASAGERTVSASATHSPRSGFWTFWYENGQKKAEGPFEAGLRHGAWIFWNEQGQVDESLSGDYAKGVRQNP